MTIFVTILHVTSCLVLIFVVLLQRGKGAEIGAVFSGSAATTIFGSRGAGNALTKLTTASAAVFMVTSFYLAYVALSAERGSVYDSPPPASAALPASDGATQTAPTPIDDFAEVVEDAAANDAEPAASEGANTDATSSPQ